mmetsp:Transcript_60181/g.145429  ORF Transcript_60181/g.145429 Transcript_60181/m.145429 type:complete len:232 (-) Transcript_60181:1165-1860(-)
MSATSRERAAAHAAPSQAASMAQRRRSSPRRLWKAEAAEAGLPRRLARLLLMRLAVQPCLRSRALERTWTTLTKKEWPMNSVPLSCGLRTCSIRGSFTVTPSRSWRFSSWSWWSLAPWPRRLSLIPTHRSCSRKARTTSNTPRPWQSNLQGVTTRTASLRRLCLESKTSTELARCRQTKTTTATSSGRTSSSAALKRRCRFGFCRSARTCARTKRQRAGPSIRPMTLLRSL